MAAPTFALAQPPTGPGFVILAESAPPVRHHRRHPLRCRLDTVDNSPGERSGRLGRAVHGMQARVDDPDERVTELEALRDHIE
jgi:hypothetical protein